MKNDIFIKNICSVTLVGVDTSRYPVQRGNCFSVIASNNKLYRIVNFSYENMEQVIKLGLKEPIKILLLSDKVAIVIDERIPDRWFDTRYCEVCCPESLLPHPQKMAIKRQEARGERTSHDNGKFKIISFDPKKSIQYLPGEEKEKLEDAARRKRILSKFKVVNANPIKAFFGNDVLKRWKKEAGNARKKNRH